MYWWNQLFKYLKEVFREHKLSATWKVSIFGADLVRIFPALSRIQNARKVRTRITPNTDTFYAVILESYNYELIILTNV